MKYRATGHNAEVKFKGMALGGIIALCIFLPPLGALFLWLRYMQNRRTLPKGATRMCVVTGVFLLLFFILWSDLTTADNPYTYLFLIAGIAGIVFAVLLVRAHAADRRLVELVGMQKLRKISAIAKSAQLSEETTVKRLVRMLSAGYFSELDFDAATNSLVLNSEEMAKIQVKAVTCERCGAAVSVYDDRANVCEYCGGALSF